MNERSGLHCYDLTSFIINMNHHTFKEMNQVMQSIPRVLVAGGNPGRWSADERAYESHYVNGVEAWVFALNGTYVPEKELTASMIAEYDLVMLNLNAIKEPQRLVKIRSLVENRPAYVHWMTLLEGDMQWYLKPLPHLKEIFNASTFVNCINAHAEAFIQSLTSAPVHTLGIPYPAEGIRNFSTPFSKRDECVLICPFLRMRQNEYAVAKQLNLPIRGFERRLSLKLSKLFSNYRTFGSMFQREVNKDYVQSIMNDPGIDIHYETRLDLYYALAGSARLWLNLDDRYTWGRYVLDAAALGVPIISTVNTGHTQKLFPDLTVSSPFAIDEAIELSRRVIEDQQFAQTACDIAWERLQEYTPENMKQRLWDILK